MSGAEKGAPVRPVSDARFYAILDSGYVPREQWIDVCARLIAGGADLVQIRTKRETSSEREHLLNDILPLFAALTAPHLIINDDLELCARYPRLGLHVGQDDTPPRIARDRLGPGRIIGLSTHSWDQARAAQTLASGMIDYFAVGPIFATLTKPDYVPVGLDLARRVAAAKPRLPWFAIGGINRKNLDLVKAAGVSRVVIVSDVLLDRDPGAAVKVIQHRLCHSRETIS